MRNVYKNASESEIGWADLCVCKIKFNNSKSKATLVLTYTAGNQLDLNELHISLKLRSLFFYQLWSNMDKIYL